MLVSVENDPVYIIREFPLTYEPVDISSLTRVLSCNWSFSAEKIGLPPELVTKVFDDHETIHVSTPAVRNAKPELLYIPAPGPMIYQQLMQIISLFNTINFVSLTIYCPAQYHSSLSTFANEHLRFVTDPQTKSKSERQSFAADAVITYGTGALHFIRQSIPVIILGPCGAGGWVTPDNFYYFLKNGFAGRPGGTLNEPVPQTVLAEEIDGFLSSADKEQTLMELQRFASAVDCLPLSEAIREISIKEQTHRYRDENQKWEQMPRIASNIRFVAQNDAIALTRSHINDTIATVDPEDAAFLRQMDGSISCRDLLERSGMNAPDFWQLLDQLSSKKIIIMP